jgi:hypothetical protein
VTGFDPNYPARSGRLLGLLTDRGFGLAAWAPAFLLAIPALAALARRRPPGWVAIVVPLAAGWLNAAFLALTMHGWWWPGRQVVVVIPCIVIAVAWWVSRYAPARAVFVVAGALGVLTFVWLTSEGLLGHRHLVEDFERTGNPWYRAWRLVLPDGRFDPAGTELLQLLWIGIALLLARWGWRSVGTRPATKALAPPIDRQEATCEPVLV